jgi:general secretion pathway protein L
MERSANSPFDASDTVSGWVETGRDSASLTVVMVIAARSALMHWFNTARGERSPDRTELWAEHDGAWVRLEGFGEAVRDRRYRSRLYRLAAYIAAGIVFVYAAAGLYVLQQRVTLQQLEAVQDRVARQSRDAATQRESLLLANEAIAAANEHYCPVPEPARRDRAFHVAARR